MADTRGVLRRTATPSRMRRWQSLARTARCDVRRHGPLLEIHYRPLAGVRTELEALIAVEAQACPFLSWALDHDFIAGQLVVQIKASPQHPDHVDAIALVAAA